MTRERLGHRSRIITEKKMDYLIGPLTNAPVSLTAVAILFLESSQRNTSIKSTLRLNNVAEGRPLHRKDSL